MSTIASRFTSTACLTEAFKHDGNEMKLAVNAFRNGNGKGVLVASSLHRRLTMDFVTTRERLRTLWKEDRGALKKLGFSLECSASKGKEKQQTHDEFYEKFQDLPVTQVTAFQGHREWHIARRLSFTSTTTHALIKVLLRHYCDLEFDCVRKVCEFMCSNYNYDERVQQYESRQSNDSDSEPGSPDSNDIDICEDEELLENGIPELIEPSEKIQLEARRDMLLFEAKRLTLDELKVKVQRGNDKYLTTFLERAGMVKIPSGTTPRKKACIKWASVTDPAHRPVCILHFVRIEGKIS